MARIRTVKPDFWTDSKIVQLSPLARLLFIGSWNFADDYGALEADALQLKLRVLPAEQCDPCALVRELLDAGLLVEATNGSETFWRIAGWEKHQKVDKRGKSLYGDPDIWTSPAEHSTTPPESPRLPSSPRPGREGKGEEGKGGETTGAARRREPDPIFDALVEACGLNAAELTKSARGRLNKATKELREIGASPDGIKARASVHQHRWPNAEMTPTSLAANYAQLGTSLSNARASPRPSKSAAYAEAWAAKAAELEAAERSQP